MKNQPKPAKVFHFDLYGKREAKYDFLNSESLASIPWTELDCPEPYHFFVPKDFDSKEKYINGFDLSDFFTFYSVGIETQRDSICVQFEQIKIGEIVLDFKNLNVNDIRTKYKIEKDGRDWQIETAKNDIILRGNFCNFFYRPFDLRTTYYTGKSKGFMAYPRSEIMNNLFEKENISLIVCKQQSSFDFQHAFVSDCISDGNSISLQTKERANVFPLYLYPATTGQQTIDQTSERTPNLNLQIVAQISEKLGLQFTNEKDASTSSASGNPGTFAPIDLLDYIYAVLHSPTYREKYKEFLKIDFPRVPYPKDVATFWQLVALGGELRQIHLLESPVVSKFITRYPVGGSNVVEKVRYENGHVYINDTQYFANAPEVAWKFYIGGYQPAQKWLKDRKGRELQFDDIQHYQKIIVALSETDRIMAEINNINIE